MNIDNWEEEFESKFGGTSVNEAGKSWLRIYDDIKEFIRDAIFFAKIDVEMTESIKRYEQSKQDGTLDVHFPTIKSRPTP